MRQLHKHAHALLEQLRTGTQAIKELMGPDTTVTDKEIEEALWYYYFDVDKSVTYLLSE